MARIRTIKPEFFTSEDIVAMSPLARLFFQACWCEADREGRMAWKPRTMKLRYFPADKCDIDAIAAEVVGQGLLRVYENGGTLYAYIPSFTKHQHVNPREAESQIPEPTEADASGTRAHASNLELTGREEGKGKEGKEIRTRQNASRLPADWEPSGELVEWFRSKRPDLNLAGTVEAFKDYWHSRHDPKASRRDWALSFKTWARNERARPPTMAPPKRTIGYGSQPG
jgi:hypothetical protein